MKSRSGKRKRLEDNRWSVFTEDLEHCYFCEKKASDVHEIIYGSNRWNSMRYGYVLPLCRTHHDMFHRNYRLTMEWQVRCQEHFMKKDTLAKWVEIFHCNYKEKLKQKYEHKSNLEEERL